MAHQQNKELMTALAECAAECYHCSTACLEEQDVKMLAECIKLDMDCAAICQATAGFIARGSDHSQHLIEECIDLCEACASECEKHSKMEHCKRCAEMCRKCVDACRKFSSGSTAGRA